MMHGLDKGTKILLKSMLGFALIAVALMILVFSVVPKADPQIVKENKTAAQSLAVDGTYTR